MHLFPKSFCCQGKKKIPLDGISQQVGKHNSINPSYFGSPSREHSEIPEQVMPTWARGQGPVPALSPALSPGAIRAGNGDGCWPWILPIHHCQPQSRQNPFSSQQQNSVPKGQSGGFSAPGNHFNLVFSSRNPSRFEF